MMHAFENFTKIKNQVADYSLDKCGSINLKKQSENNVFVS